MRTRSFLCLASDSPVPAENAAARDVAALHIHALQCPGGDGCEGPVFEDYQHAAELLAALARAEGRW